MIGRNIVWNALGGGTALVLGIVVVPLQTMFLGLSAYGIVGFIFSLQVVINLLDLGMTTTAIRAVTCTEDGRDPRTLITSITGLSWLVALVAGVVFAALSPVITDAWIRPDAGMRDEVVVAIALAVVSFAVRLPATCQVGILAGHQRLDLVNILRVGNLVLRHGGSIAVLAIIPSLSAFATWLLVSAVIEVLVNTLVLQRLRGDIGWIPQIDKRVLPWIWRSCAGLSMLTIQSLILTQADRWLIARIGSSEDLGRYTVAYQIAYGMAIVQAFVTAALLPAFSDRTQADQRSHRRELGCEALAMIQAPIAAGAWFFATWALGLFLGPIDAEIAGRCLGILAIGFLINAAFAVPLADAVANGTIFGILVMNWLLVLPYVAAVYWGYTYFGIGGPAWAWVALNLVYLAIVPAILVYAGTAHGILGILKRRVFPFWAMAFASFGLGFLVVRHSGHAVITIGVALAAILYACIAWFLADPQFRSAAKSLIGRHYA